MNEETVPKRSILDRLERLAEIVIFNSRYLLILLYISLVLMILSIAWDFIRTFPLVSELLDGWLGSVTPAQMAEHTLRALDLLDFTMIANLIWLISAGSLLIFVAKYDPDAAPRVLPRSLAHLSTGILKEKMAGSIVGVSSVNLLGYFLHISVSSGVVDWQKVGALIAIHLTFIAGLLAFNYTNAADHHNHDQPKPKEKEQTHA